MQIDREQVKATLKSLKDNYKNIEKEIAEKTEIQQQSHAHRYTKILT